MGPSEADPISSEPQRILMVITELDPGGAERCLTHLACYLAARGHTVRVLGLGKPPSVEQDVLLKQLQAAGVSYDFAGAVTNRALLRVWRWLRREIRAFDPDVIQSMLFHANCLTFMAIPTGTIRFFGGVRVRQPERWRLWLERLAIARMERLVCVSQDVADYCVSRQQVSPEKIVVIPNGIELAGIDHMLAKPASPPWTSLGIPVDARVLLFVGRLHPQKGIEGLFAQATALLQRLPEHHLVVVGTGPLAARLEHLKQGLQAGHRVHLAGWQTQPLDWMRHAELLLLPAAYEGMPNVVLEAMAIGLPVVAFDVDGVRQLLGAKDQPESAAQRAAAGDFTEFNERIIALATNTALRQQCRTHNRRRVDQQFQLAAQLAKYESLYAVHHLLEQR